MNHIMLEAGRYLVLTTLIVLLLPPPAASITPPTPQMSDYPNPYRNNIQPRFGLVVLVTTSFIFFVAFLGICARHCSNRRHTVVTGVVTARARRGHNGGLDPAVLETFPIFNYSDVKEMKIGKGALECAVCLSEFEEDETLRFLPKCDHVFHAECIDTWLGSHATCPVCRANLVPVPGESYDVPVLSPTQPNNQNDEVSIRVEERPLNTRALIRSRTHGMSGRRRWFGLFLRSNSTGHVEVGDTERFTLRLPAEFRRQVIGGKLSRTTSCLDPSTEVENRVGLGGSYKEGSSQGKLSGGQYSKADRWVYSVTRPFSTVAQQPV